MKTPDFYVAPSGDVHVNVGPQPVADPRAVADMCEIDAAADREWLAQNPEAYQRMRPSSFREIVALGLPVGSTTVTRRGKHGSSNAVHVGFRNWQNSLGIPSDYHEAFINLVTSEPRNRTAFFIAGIPTPFENAFDATLALHLDDDINRVGRAQELAIALAGAIYPENPTDSARLIREWLRRNGRASRTQRQLETAIAGGGGPQSGRVKPQDAARNILDYFQQQVLGEDETPSTPPLRYFRGDYYRWSGQTWEQVADIRPLVVRALQTLHNNLKITRQFVGSVIDNSKRSSTFL